MSLPAHIDPSFAAWFSGFIDGEGYLQLCPQSSSRRISPRLVIQLREDDIPLLEEIQERLQCGNLYNVSKEYDRRNGNKSADQGMWVVTRREEIMRVIIPLFEEFPLRSKKKGEFEIWKQAATLVAKGANNSSKGRRRLKSLKDALMMERNYWKRDEDREKGSAADEPEENQYTLFCGEDLSR